MHSSHPSFQHRQNIESIHSLDDKISSMTEESHILEEKLFNNERTKVQTNLQNTNIDLDVLDIKRTHQSLIDQQNRAKDFKDSLEQKEREERFFSFYLLS